MFSTFSQKFYHYIQQTTALLDAFLGSLPSLCPICQLPQSTSLFCAHCYSMLARTEFSCFQCAEPLPESARSKANTKFQAYYCGKCQSKPPLFDQVIAQLVYQEPLSKLIHRFKFSHQLNLLPSLADCLIQQIQTVSVNDYQMPDAIIAVPLHPKRMRQRGFNQSLLLANRVSKHFRIPLLKHLVKRTIPTDEQSSLNRKQRRKNIYKAFEISKGHLKQASQLKKVVIIDDVITSGSTCNELAKILKKAGVTIVDIWCIAKTPFIK